jgi:hypothetical protein
MDKATQKSYNYIVSAAYDQGSTIGKIMKPSDVLTLNNFPNKVIEYVYENLVLVASELAIIPVTWIVLKWWLTKRYKNSAIDNITVSYFYCMF